MNEKKPGRPRKSDYTRTDAENEELDNLFSDISQSYTVKVYRQDPEWCAGYCGSFHLGAGKSLSPEEVKNRFGGRMYDLVVYDPTRGGIARKRTIMIDDVPRREGAEMRRDGTVMDGKSSAQQKTQNPLDALMDMPLPPALKRQVAAYYVGIPDDAKPQNNHTDFLQQQMMMDMMNQSRQAQMHMMQQQFDMAKRMMDAMREMDESRKPRDPMHDVNTTIKLMREINGIKSELGVQNGSLAGQVLETTVPLIETALTEYLAYKKMQAQAQLMTPRQPQIPALPIRDIAPKTTDDPLLNVKQLAQQYKKMDSATQRELMNAFLGAMDEPPEIVANSMPYDTIEADMLTDEDRLILYDKHNTEAHNMADSQHATSADHNDQDDRAGD